MNDTTLPIKKKTNPRRNRGGPEGRVRPGFGLHDWINLTRHAKDLAQRKGASIRRDIPASEVKTHNKPHDGWIILRGKVYNISPYLAYHPGGADIIEKCLGRDATVLFDKYHRWVNLDGLVGCLLLGYLKVEKRKADDDSGGYLNGSGGNNDIVVPTATSAHESTPTEGANDNLGFAMPKPRPPKGKPIASLLSHDNDDESDNKEEDTLKF